MLDKLKKLFSSSARKDQERLFNDATEISIDTEINLIKSLLEKKFHKRFQIRVKVNGYLGEELKYCLVIDDYCDHSTTEDCHYHSIFGNDTTNILDVKLEFLKAYWYRVDKVHQSVGQKLSKWDYDRIEDYKKMMVVESREELIMLAKLEGIC